jgi:hypothetical protein
MSPSGQNVSWMGAEDPLVGEEENEWRKRSGKTEAL